ncbi:hypothetical protein AB0M20_37710 [Actinoplanes sp. NPDC051633]|uniref:WXG100-like domain-containing protein n=1 Tax=Actinoplanes sp. NPDC051633 TaxID=3155670 RepID=UPI0034351272
MGGLPLFGYPQGRNGDGVKRVQQSLMSVNPLVAAASSGGESPWAGVWIAEDIELIASGVRSGSWVDTSLGAVSAGLDGLALISDPAGALLQYGIAWLIEHVKPLSEALDWLAGDPAQIAAHAQTWRNAAAALREESEQLTRAVRTDVSGWTGSAAEAYQRWAAQRALALTALASGSDTMALVTEGAGALIGTVRLMVRDAVATVVSRLVVYAAELLATFGAATPLVAEQVATLCASWAARIAHWLRALLASLRNLLRECTSLADLIRKLRARLRPDSRDLHRGADGIVRNGKKILMTRENVDAMAAKYGIDMVGIEYSIDKVRVGQYAGITKDDQTVILTRSAFVSERELARTLAHERFHVEEIRSGKRVPFKTSKLQQWEDRAEAYEEEWWQEHQHLMDE